MTRIACIGEVMIELSLQTTETAQIGIAGDTYNTAVYLAHLLKGRAEVHYVTVLGQDAFSDRILAHIQTHGIAQNFVARHPTKTPGLYAIETDDQGERRFSYWRSDSAARTLFGPECTIDMNILSQFDLVYVSGISLAILPPTQRHALIEALIYYQARGGTVAYDSNHRPKLWESPEIARETNAIMWDFATLALPSIDDEMHIFNDADATDVIARLCKHGPRVGALKQGHVGPYDLEQSSVHTYGAVETVVDSTAAGDSFNAGFLAGYIVGASVGERLIQAHDLAARVVQHRGAILPDGELVRLANRRS